MGKNPPKWLPGDRVNETILVQRKSVEQLNADRLLRRDKLKERREKHKLKLDAKRKKKLSTKKFISAQTILNQAIRKQRQSKAFSKLGEKFESKHRHETTEDVRNTYGANSRVALVVRSKGKLIPTEVTVAFRRMGLDKIYSARLVRLTPSTDKALTQLRPFVILGYPTMEQLTQLLKTRGAFWNRESKSRRMITGNMLVEQTLGQYNILCIEDLAEAIASPKPVANLEHILASLAPFDFHPPRQLFLERHRSVHQKLEVVNPESFAAYLTQQLSDTSKAQKASKKKEAKKAAASAPKAAAAANKKTAVKKAAAKKK